MKKILVVAVISIVQMMNPTFAQVQDTPNSTFPLGGNEASQKLCDEASALVTKGQYQEALNKFQLAAKAAPTSSLPLSGMAELFLYASTVNSGEAQQKMRQQAEAAARQALKLVPTDPIAQEVLRVLAEDKPFPQHAPSTEVAKIMNEGETLFAGGQYDGARKRYEEAAQLDPQYSEAWVYAGDCFFRQKSWGEAETRFRRATEIEPNNGKAWRYLSDSLMKQNKLSEAEDALLRGIAASPGQLPNWDKLAQLKKNVGKPLVALNMKRKARISIDPKTDKANIVLDQGVSDSSKSADQAVWLAYAVRQLNLMRPANGASTLTPYQIEIDAWQTAMKVADELAHNANLTMLDPALITIQKMVNENQLEPTVLLLMYRESYRPELEAWKKAHPDGVRDFVTANSLRP